MFGNSKNQKFSSGNQMEAFPMPKVIKQLRLDTKKNVGSGKEQEEVNIHSETRGEKNSANYSQSTSKKRIWDLKSGKTRKRKNKPKNAKVSRSIDLVYGKGNVGLMGLVSQAAHDSSSHVIGLVYINMLAAIDKNHGFISFLLHHSFVYFLVKRAGDSETNPREIEEPFQECTSIAISAGLEVLRPKASSKFALLHIEKVVRNH
ncbi:hypothetical protein LguiA_017168 [Lonicera macranthoides]